MKKHILAALALVALVGCSESRDEQATLDDNMVRISSGIATRAVDQTWAYNDAISVFAYNTGYTTAAKAIAENVQHNADAAGESSTFTPDSSDDYFFYPTDGTNIDVYAIYPYADATTLTAYSIDVTTAAQTDHTLIDLMAAKAADKAKSAYAIDMTFDHKLAQVKVALSAATDGGLTDDELKTATVTLGGTKVAGSYNITTDKITTSGYATSIVLTSVAGATTFMVIPQEAALEFTITVDGVDYLVSTTNFTIESGNIYTYAISVSQTAVKIEGSTINAWGSGGGDSLDASDHVTPDIELANGIYYINTAAGLTEFASLVNNGDTSINATLINDIDLSDICYEVTDGDDVSWTPIGDYNKKYSGTFDGGGYTISGLYINSTSDYQGLFGYVDGGSISNITLSEPEVAGGRYTGAVCGYATSTPIESCGVVGGSVSGTTTSSNVSVCVGGVAGSASSITLCYNTGEVSGTSSSSNVSVCVGGVAGSSSSITSCYNTGDVSVTSSSYVYVGGVVGEAYSSVTECYNTGEVSGTSDSSYSGVFAGGVVGISYSYDITSCYNTGNISITSSSSSYVYAGGVVGISYSSSITSCYNIGNVCVTSDSSDVYAGGVVGSSSTTTITSCYNTGEVSGSGSTNNVGGIVGTSYSSSSVTSCYFINSLVYGVGNSADSSYDYMKLSSSSELNGVIATMNSAASSITSTTYVEDTGNINDGYPILSWQLND